MEDLGFCKIKVESSVLNTLTDFVNLCASGTLPVEITQPADVGKSVEPIGLNRRRWAREGPMVQGGGGTLKGE